jgi:hypothetical protein
MFKLLSPLAIAGAILSLSWLGAAPALALSPVTFDSGKGTDTGTCADPHPAVCSNLRSIRRAPVARSRRLIPQIVAR